MIIKSFVLITICFLGGMTDKYQAPQSGVSVIEYRNMVDKAAKNEESAERFYKLTRSISEKNQPRYLVFKAMAELMMCNYVGSPLSKLSYFKKGKAVLEDAVAAENNPVESIFYRYTIQTNVPGILNYKSNIESDKKRLIAFLKVKADGSAENKDLHERVKKYLLENKNTTAQEKSMIKAL